MLVPNHARFLPRGCDLCVRSLDLELLCLQACIVYRASISRLEGATGSFRMVAFLHCIQNYPLGPRAGQPEVGVGTALTSVAAHELY